MTTKQIEMILKVSETLNFTKAAEAMFLTQPTLTYQIQMAEEELRFKIFDRSQKSVALTPSGKTFVESLRPILNSYRIAVEQAQNYSERFNEDIVISLPYRSAIHLLPQAMREMAQSHPEVLITPKFGWNNRLNEFLQGTVDILFDDFDTLKNLKDVRAIPFYQSRIYLVCNRDDPLAEKSLIHASDLIGRTLMVGGGSQRQLREVQTRVLNETRIPFINSEDHDTTLTNIAAGKAIVLAPGFLHDRNDGFAWVPFECHETISCCLGVKVNDKRPSLKAFIDILLHLYEEVNISTL
ncbi:MAG: LysR family transcriptional regulator [Bacilli bacterium]|nr:LysR family transcriptional regulator [Bacilli bacterium]